MNVKTVYKLSGYLSIIIGVTGTLCIYMKYLYVAVLLSIFGLVFAIINIFLNEKYYFEQVKYPKGYIGMFISSLPIVFVMLLIFKFRK
jgi:hypothetical protein